VPGKKSPNEKLNVAAIGAGGKGRGDIRGCSDENVVALCDVDAGSTNYENQWHRGLAPAMDAVKQHYFEEIEAAREHDGLYLFFFSAPWSQREPMRFDLAGMGTEADPGIQWVFECLKRADRR